MGVACESQVEIWHDSGNTIYTNVLSDGTTGENWINRMESSGVWISDRAKSFFKTKKFKISENKETDIEIIKLNYFTKCPDIFRIKHISHCRNLKKALPEVVCLLQQQLFCRDLYKISVKRIMIMHEAYEQRFLCLIMREGLFIIDMISMYEPWQRTDGFAFSFKK